MILYPAVDLQNGKAVRLNQGKRDESDIYAQNPLDAANKWINEGAKWLHIVDLDGAFDGSSANFPIIKELAKLPVKIQIGGGARSLSAAEKFIDAGADRLIIGTVALEDPVLFREMAAAFPGKVGVSLDAANGVLKTRGWVKSSNTAVDIILPRLEDDGAAFIIYTDIERDGTRAGVNLAALANVLRKTRLPVIAAGGLATLSDIKKLADLAATGNLDGAISGRALYEKTLDFREATTWLENFQADGK